ncbi:MAG: hypothetical protein D6772_02720, partial [Bacteroidetes bacterium]
RVELEQTLKEISGIASLNADQVLSIQDEKGILFTVDLNMGNIVSRDTFDKDRDYEDLCIVGEYVMILERDGDLYQYHTTADTTIKFETLFSYRNDTEALTYDANNEQLLIAPKEGAPDGYTLPANVHGIYAFDLQEKRLKPEPIITISEKEVGRAVGNGGKPYVFKPSAIAIHPTSRHIYVLASVGKLLLVLGSDGELLHVQLLDEQLFPQPEGLTFDREGNLLIASEGVLQAASITRFSPSNTLR